jgi:hypothetical protein
MELEPYFERLAEAVCNGYQRYRKTSTIFNSLPATIAASWRACSSVGATSIGFAYPDQYTPNLL